MLRYLLEKEFKQFFRNKFLPKMVVAMPFMALAVFPLVADMDVKNLSLAVVDNDRSQTSRQMQDKIVSSGNFRMSGYFDNSDAALESIEKGDADLLLEIPSKFEETLYRENSGTLMIAANAVNGMKGGLGSAYLTGIIADYNRQWIMDNGQWRIDNEQIRMNNSQLLPPRESDTFTEFSHQGAVPTINSQFSILNSQLVEVLPLFRFNPALSYKVFMIPALMAMMLAMICGFLPALNIVSEKENGTIEQMNVTPVRKFTFILSKLVPYWTAGFVVSSLCMLTAFIFYGLAPKGSILLLYLFAAVFVLSFSGFGLIVSNYAKNIQQAIFIMFFFVITMIFLSGLFTPYQNMPAWAQMLGNASPLKYFIQVLRMIYLKGATFMDMQHLFYPLCVLAVFFNGWAVMSYRKKSR
jgi:ABC-2 type transport system permease protein